MGLFELKWGAEAMEEGFSGGVGRAMVKRKVERRHGRKHLPILFADCFLDWKPTLCFAANPKAISRSAAIDRHRRHIIICIPHVGLRLEAMARGFHSVYSTGAMNQYPLIKNPLQPPPKQKRRKEKM